jgi:hypothetical protein
MRPESRESGRNRPSNRPCKPEIVAIRNRVHQLTLRRVLCRSSLEKQLHERLQLAEREKRNAVALGKVCTTSARIARCETLTE